MRIAQVLELGIKLIVNIFEIYVICRYLDVLFEKKLRDKKLLKMLLCIKLMIMIAVDYYAPYVWVNFLTSAFLMLLLSCCYHATLRKKIVVSLLLDILLILSEAMVVLFAGIGSFEIFSKAANEQTVELFLSRVCFWAMLLLVKKFKNVKLDVAMPWEVWILEGLLLILTFMQMMLIYSQTEMNKVVTLTWLLGAGVTIYLLIYLYDTLAESITERTKTELIRKEKSFYHKEAQILQQNYEATRQFRHDLRNRMQVLQKLVEDEEYEGVKTFIARISEKSSDMQLYSQTGNLAVDSIINSKLQLAKEKEIRIDAKIAMPKEVITDEDDMVVILGNLLDNAIEASERVREKREIIVRLQYKEGCMYLHVKNSYDQIVNVENGRLVTRKQDKLLHGIGIRSVESTVEKYNGIVEISQDKEMFTVDVMMYL